MLSENLLQLYPVGVALKGVLLPNSCVTDHHSLEMNEYYYYYVIYGLLVNGRIIVYVYLHAFCVQNLCVWYFQLILYDSKP